MLFYLSFFAVLICSFLCVNIHSYMKFALFSAEQELYGKTVILDTRDDKAPTRQQEEAYDDELNEVFRDPKS
jgi:hypothetical protein